MEYKILESNGVENENVDGAAFNNFTAGGRNGIIKGILNECFVSIESGKTISVNTGEIIIQGFRVKITSAYSHTFASFPAVSLPYQLVAKISLFPNKDVSFSLDCREVKTLVQDDLYSVEQGTYEAEIAQFTLTSEVAKDLIRSMDIISAGTGTGTVDLSNYYTKEEVEALINYKPITINSFTNDKNTVEIGSTITSVTLNWSFSKKPVSVTLDGVSKGIDSTGETLSGLSLTGNKTWTLNATDEKGGMATKTTAISFLNGVYYGVASEPSAYNSDFVLGLTKTLRSNKLTSISVNAGSGQYIYYCLPTRMGACSFKVGGFDGGFTHIATISFTNSNGYTESYYIYKSDNAGLGSTTVSIS